MDSPHSDHHLQQGAWAWGQDLRLGRLHPRPTFPEGTQNSILGIPLALRLHGLCLTRWNFTYLQPVRRVRDTCQTIHKLSVGICWYQKMYSQFEQMLVKTTLEWKRRHVQFTGLSDHFLRLSVVSKFTRTRKNTELLLGRPEGQRKFPEPDLICDCPGYQVVNGSTQTYQVRNKDYFRNHQ